MAIRDEIGYTKLTLEIGDWDMNTDFEVDVAHGLSATEWLTIRSVDVIIQNDSDAVPRFMRPLTGLHNPSLANERGGVSWITDTNIRLHRAIGVTPFDDASHDLTPFNRGWITLEYIAD